MKVTMKVTELSRDELIQLKAAYAIDMQEKDGWKLSLGELIEWAEKISDEEIYDYYSGIEFVKEDFFCNNSFFIMKELVLVQNDKCSIIYGTFRGEENQELFRCPRELDDIDLRRYVNENRILVGFERDDTKNLREVPGKELIGYWRMYYSGGWCGRWLFEKGDGFHSEELTKLDCKGVDEIIEWFWDNYPDGCNFIMEEDMQKHFGNWGCENRHLIKPKYSDYYKVLIDTTYGNGDYPVRIYVYKDKEMEV